MSHLSPSASHPHDLARTSATFFLFQTKKGNYEVPVETRISSP